MTPRLPQQHPLCLRIIILLILSTVRCSDSLSIATTTTTATPSSSSSSSHRHPLRGKTICIAGGGPCGLFLAGLLLEEANNENDDDAGIHVRIYEQQPREGKPGNAFGMGLSRRLLNNLETLDIQLRRRVESVGAQVDAPFIKDDDEFDFRIASRQDICEQITQYLEERYGGNDGDGQRRGRLTISFGEGCTDVNFQNKTIRTSKGNDVPYDLLIAADGVNSMIRRKLVQECENEEDENEDENNSPPLQEEHYLEPKRWKALRLPRQPDLDANSFKPLKHPVFAGRIIPRYPEGHMALLFYGETDERTGMNPRGASTIDELKVAMTEALTDDNKPSNKFQFLSRWIGMGGDTDIQKNRTVLFDDIALQQFLDARPGRSHYMKINRYHDIDRSVAIIGDAAHGMSSFLGQGCACGLQNTVTLSNCLKHSDTVESALEEYSTIAVPEGHAITDLNLIACILRGGILAKLLAIPPSLWLTIRGKSPMNRIGKPELPFVQLLRENRALVALGKLFWRGQRVPIGPNDPGTSSASARPTDT